MNDVGLKRCAIAHAMVAFIDATGGVGPFGSEPAKLHQNEIALESQSGQERYAFDEHANASLTNQRSVYKSMVADFGEDDVESETDFMQRTRKISLGALMSEHTWFMAGSKRLNDALVEFVNAIVEEGRQ